VGCSSRSTRGRGLGFAFGHALTKVIACSGEATGVSEARLVRERMAENATREPGSHAEADRCVVKRPIPQSPFPGEQAMERERGASFEEMLGTPEARVLVNEAVGSRSRLGRIEARALSLCRKAGERRRASPSQTFGIR